MIRFRLQSWLQVASLIFGTWIFAASNFGSVETIDDIEFWTGTGPNRSALAIDWEGQNSSSESLVWGYRWDSPQTTADMLLSIVADDPRLFAKVGSFGKLGLAVYGIGFDASGDGEFAVSDGTAFDEDGIAITGPADLSVSVDPNDFYQEGWFLGFWHHGVSDSSPPDWQRGAGVTDRELINNSWDSLAFTASVFDDTSFASNLHTAERDTIPGDYNRNGRIDAADFTVWRDNLDTTTIAAGYGADGNLDQQITMADLDVWIDAYLNGPSSIPEPNFSIFSLGLLFIGLDFMRARHRI